MKRRRRRRSEEGGCLAGKSVCVCVCVFFSALWKFWMLLRSRPQSTPPIHQTSNALQKKANNPVSHCCHGNSCQPARVSSRPVSYLHRARTPRTSWVRLIIWESKVILVPPPCPRLPEAVCRRQTFELNSLADADSHKNSSHAAVYGFVTMTEVMTPVRVHV